MSFPTDFPKIFAILFLAVVVVIIIALYKPDSLKILLSHFKEIIADLKKIIPKRKE